MGDTGESCRISPPCLVPHGFHCIMVWTQNSRRPSHCDLIPGWRRHSFVLAECRSPLLRLEFCTSTSKLNLLLSISNLYLPQTVLFVPLNSSKIHPAQTSLTVAVNWTSPLLSFSLSLPLSVSIGNINSEVSLCISRRFTSSQHQGLQ